MTFGGEEEMLRAEGGPGESEGRSPLTQKASRAETDFSYEQNRVPEAQKREGVGKTFPTFSQPCPPSSSLETLAKALTVRSRPPHHPPGCSAQRTGGRGGPGAPGRRAGGRAQE